MASKYYFSTRDLLVIAVLAALGGVLSTYVSYLANMINHLVGVPFGAGNVVAGLHVLWLLLMIAITRKVGAGLIGGTLKGFVEFLTGNPHGIIVVVISMIEGLGAELGYWPLRKYRMAAYMLGGGLGAFANVLVFQLLYNSYGNVYLFGLWGGLAFISGAVIAGYFTGGVMDNLEDAGIVRREKPKKGLLSFSLPKAFALVLAVVILFSAIYYFALVQVREDPMVVHVTGKIVEPKDYYLPTYRSDFITVNSPMDGTYKHYPAQDYSGLSIDYILDDARASADATKIDVVAMDGYYQTFNISEIRGKGLLLNISDVESDSDYVRLVAPGFAGGMWVRNVNKIKVY
jgi:ABC-type thiamin/hydroxymethylpyrimidine transport system permease subunit